MCVSPRANQNNNRMDRAGDDGRRYSSSNVALMLRSSPSSDLELCRDGESFMQQQIKILGSRNEQRTRPWKMKITCVWIEDGEERRRRGRKEEKEEEEGKGRAGINGAR